jgi:hypothetical protein
VAPADGRRLELTIVRPEHDRDYEQLMWLFDEGAEALADVRSDDRA